jgi:hypothetical protein
MLMIHSGTADCLRSTSCEHSLDSVFTAAGRIVVQPRDDGIRAERSRAQSFARNFNVMGSTSV